MWGTFLTPQSTQKREKIDTKIDRKIDAFRNRSSSKSPEVWLNVMVTTVLVPGLYFLHSPGGGSISNVDLPPTGCTWQASRNQTLKPNFPARTDARFLADKLTFYAVSVYTYFKTDVIGPNANFLKQILKLKKSASWGICFIPHWLVVFSR